MKQVKRNKHSAYKLKGFSLTECNNVVCVCLVNEVVNRVPAFRYPNFCSIP